MQQNRIGLFLGLGFRECAAKQIWTFLGFRVWRTCRQQNRFGFVKGFGFRGCAAKQIRACLGFRVWGICSKTGLSLLRVSGLGDVQQNRFGLV